MRFPYIAAACAILLAACAAPQPQSVASPGASPSPAAASPAPSRAPESRESAVPGATPAPPSEVRTAAPVETEQPQGEATSPPVTPTPEKTPVTLPPDAPPQIVELDLNNTVVQSGQTVSGMVLTSSNVASVEARIANYSINVPKVAPGKFALTYDVPNVPFFLKRTYDMVVIARNTAGAEATRTIPITIR